ncbi:hypothetical protein ACJMK2_031560 [Sinanodonta woodiana]|uniref:Phosphorylase b kinase regulatory subunit n=1 Tax=Sinanodonta woodiana TaxID=1069815 RepID=A0ABD3X1A8_SINWO
MRNRSNSGVRLDYYQRLVNRTILKHQSPVTGLFPASETNSHAWVRDNVYSIYAVWGLALAYRKTADLDEDLAKAFELEQSVVKLMRGLLLCMMNQVDKLEKFKHTQNPRDSLHAKYCSKTSKVVVGDNDWGHLQIDATSLYLLTLAQMTASGLQIIYTLDEVAFIQNLVFYIETAYRNPDYGIWERGDKTNHGLPELNSSSIGMAKAALEAINETDLFGARGGPASIIHVLPDEAQQCQAILHSMLPRESSSKEIDAGLITVISFPAFAVDDPEIINRTREDIKSKLMGKYGFARFLRDGYKTAREDSKRLHYEPWELQMFEKIECHWPMFFAYFMLDGLFNTNTEQIEEFKAYLEEVIIKTEDGIPMLPELYTVPADKVDQEIRKPNSQKRNPIGKLPNMWGQSMYILGRIVDEGFISPGELDPLNRRLVMEPKPDVVVQVVILAEDALIQSKLAYQGIEVQTVPEVDPIRVYPARVLSQLYSLLGKNKHLGLTGRPSSEIGLLATSKLYVLQDQTLAFIPQFVDQHQFYLPLDIEFLVDHMKNNVDFLARNWRMMGRPTFIFPVNGAMLDQFHEPPSTLVATIKKLQSGYIAGTRVHLGTISDFVSTSCVTKLSFVHQLDDNSQGHGQLKVSNLESQIMDMIGDVLIDTCPRPRLLSQARKSKKRHLSTRSTASVAGIVRRTRSIQVDPEQIPDGQNSKYSIFHSPSEENHSIHHLKGSPCPSPKGSPTMQRKYLFMDPKHFHSDVEYENVNVTELLEQLNQTEVLSEQADVIHFLFVKKGPDWDTEVGGNSCTVRELLVELYEKAGHWKQWWLVRHSAGMLRKRVEDLALAVTDLLVRQKQLSVGLPPHREKIITRPLPPDELAAIIYDACGEDLSTASLTQELLIYLAMFIRTEPKLFNEMLRLRVGLIIQVMASELSRALKCSGEEASDHLVNLSPYELKTLLHHILSGKEFVISSADSVNIGEKIISADRCKSQMSRSDLPTVVTPPGNTSVNEVLFENSENSEDRQGQWLRRRRLDGALNRVPVGFYSRVWKVLEKCDGLSLEGQFLPQSLTREMTPGEFKFALQVETVLNKIPQPEYRQLMVEALMVLTMLTEDDCSKINLRYVIHVDRLVHEANNLFIADQHVSKHVIDQYKGAAGICQHLYDSAPSGRYGTMSYLCRAVAKQLHLPFGPNGDLECAVS